MGKHIVTMPRDVYLREPEKQSERPEIKVARF
jgi:hypothetical protein